VDASGPLAVEQGSFIVSLKAGSHAPAGMGAVFPDTCKYVTVWKKVNGQWLVLADINNSNRNRAVPVAAPKRH
jgi:hypothetical protein